MPEFQYTALDSRGKKVDGTVSAATKREAVAAISARDLYPVSVSGEEITEVRKRVRRIPAQTMAVVYGQLADLLKSGVPLLRAINIIRSQTSHQGLKDILSEIHRRVEDGAGLADAMLRFPNVFDEMSISMIRAGHEGGFLEEALMRVAEFTEASDDLKKRVVGAMAYPVLLLGMGTLVIIGLLVFLVPKFETLFENLRQRNEMPALTEWLLGVSTWLQSWGLWVFPAIILGVWTLRQWFRTDTGRMIWDRYIIMVPMVGSVVLNFAVARFCRVLGTLLRNGVPILRALDIAADSTGNRVLGESVRKATENVSAGQSLAGPLAAGGCFPQMVVEMISVAEEANTLETVLLEIADSLERRTWRRLDIVVRLLEPILLILLAGAVLVVVLALLLPVFKMGMSI
ncbi:MAG: type II secretion system F family protein [Planctomycetota bacterium]|nr:MAG: type II secretion system F family protein [Planctomycetota bacterium]